MMQIRLGQTEQDHRPHCYRRVKMTNTTVTLECWICLLQVTVKRHI